MFTWMCRVMLLVFSFQIFAPQLVQAGDTYATVQKGISEGKEELFAKKLKELDSDYQNWRQTFLVSNGFDLTNPQDAEIFHTWFEAPQLQRLEQLKVSWFDRIFLDGKYAELWDRYHNPVSNINHLRDQDICKLYSAITDLHVESTWLGNVETRIRNRKDQQAFNNAYLQALQGDTGPLDTLQKGRIAAWSDSSASSLIKNIENGTITPEELIDLLDPWRSNEVNLNNIVIAGEILSNTLDQWEQESAAAGEGWDEEAFQEETDEFLLKLQLRAMYRLSQLKPLSYLHSDPQQIAATGTLYLLLQKITNFYQRQRRRNPLSRKKYSCPTTTLNATLYTEGNISSAFYDQIYHFAGTKFKPDALEYQNFLSILDYAVAFQAARGAMDDIKIYVDILDKTLSRDKFDQRLTLAVEYLFLTWYENIRYSSCPGVFSSYKPLRNLFEYFLNNQNRYALPTRIFALEVLGAMARSQDADSDGKLFFRQGIDWIKIDKEIEIYEYFGMPEESRLKYATRAADIYCSLVSTRTTTLGSFWWDSSKPQLPKPKMKSYGLDSSQMQKLANKLAWIYNNFYDLGAYKDQLATPGSKRKLPPGSQCDILLQNHVNSYQAQRERENQITYFIAESVFWIYGGEIFTLVGKALRITRGAFLSLPRALKAAARVNKGRKGLAFSVELQKGARMANLSKTLARNGVKVTAVRNTKQVTERSVVNTSARGAGTTTATTTATGKHALRNKYSPLNPRRWIGQEPGQVLEYKVTQQRPGLDTAVGTVEGKLLPNGVRSYQDWRIFRRNIFDETGKRIQLNTYSWADQQLLRSEASVLRSIEKMHNNGAFDLLIPYGAPGEYINLRQFSSIEEAKQVLTSYMANPTEEMLLVNNYSAGEFFPGDIRISLRDITSGMWKNKVAQKLYTQLDWGSRAGNMFMPRYIPNDTTLFESPARMIWESLTSSNFLRSFLNTSTSLLGLDWIDRVVNPWVQSWIMKTAEDEQNESLKTHPQLQQITEENAQMNQEVDEQNEERTIYTASLPSMYYDVSATTPTHEASALSFLFLSALHYPSKLNFPWESPFLSKDDRLLLDIGAKGQERWNLEQHYFQSKAKQDMNQQVESSLQNIYAEKDNMLAFLNQFKQAFPNEHWKKEENTIKSIYKNYEKEIRAAAKDDKTGKKIEEINLKYQKKVLNLLADVDIHYIHIRKKNIPDEFAELNQHFPGDWNAEIQAYNSLYAAYEADIRAMMKITDFEEQNKRKQEIDLKYQQKEKDIQEAIGRKANQIRLAPDGEDAFFRDFIAECEQKIQEISDIRHMLELFPAGSDQTQTWLKEYQQTEEAFLKKVKQIASKKVPFEEKYNELVKANNERNQQIDNLNKKIYQSSGKETDYRPASFYPEMFAE